MKFIIKIAAFFGKNYKPAAVIYLLIVIAITIQQSASLSRIARPDGGFYYKYNNYVIFKNSFLHLIHQQDLYQQYPVEQYDLFKYSPAFALFFGQFAYLPNALGLFSWGLLNAFCLFFAIKSLPDLADKKKIAILFFVLIELITSIQNSQSNALVAGLIILAFSCLEKRNYFAACLFIVTTAFIKIFGLLGFVLFLFYPGKVRMVAYAAICFLFFAFVPLVAIPYDQLLLLYKSWLHLLVTDQPVAYHPSFSGWLESWFHLFVANKILVAGGLFFFLLPLIKWKQYVTDFHARLWWLSSLLIWVVIFNHKAESPTFIIAVAGAAIWYFGQERNVANQVLIWLVFVFTALSPTDIFPDAIQDDIFIPYVIKVVPCIFVWFKITFDLLTSKQAPALS